jgi:Flp pilus assembly pilin Flp
MKAKDGRQSSSLGRKMMENLMNTVRKGCGKHSLARDERGLSTVEYVIILVLVAAAAIGLWISFGTILKSKITGATNELDKVEIKEDK